jgi:Zn-dependent protease with chaperone function
MFRLRCLPFLVALSLAPAAGARAEDIADVLQRSQQQQLDALPAADPGSAKAQALQRSFDALVAALPGLPAAELRVVRGPVLAQTLHGRVVVAHESLGALPEAERLFVLAHELGHVMRAHWAQMTRLYQRWVPVDVRPETTGPVAARLGREASMLSHRQEFEADAFALELLRRTGHDPEAALAAFVHLGVSPDTATHPGTRKRVASLRAGLLQAP